VFITFLRSSTVVTAASSACVIFITFVLLPIDNENSASFPAVVIAVLNAATSNDSVFMPLRSAALPIQLSFEANCVISSIVCALFLTPAVAVTDTFVDATPPLITEYENFPNDEAEVKF